MSKQIVILGAGLAGTIAYGSMSSHDIKVFEAKKEQDSGLAGHYAVMRFRDPDVCKYIGCNADPITVHKMIEFHGKLYNEATIAMNNLYSLKVSEGLHERSTKSLGNVPRYMANFRPLSKSIVRYNLKLKRLKTASKELIFADAKDNEIEVPYDICISTLPMPVMLDICGIETGVTFQQEQIYIKRFKLKIPSTVHQTIYITNPETPVYRATIEGDVMIVESMEELSMYEVGKEWEGHLYHYILPLFGITNGHLEDEEDKQQELGKVIPIDDDLRKVLIMEMTDKYGIYSFGRHAIWKGVRADHLLDDIEKIKRVIHLSDQKEKYSNRML